MRLMSCGDVVRRGAAAIRGELSGVHPRLSLALAVSSAIPPFSLGHVRVGLLRLGGVRIGARTIVGGRVWIAGGSAPADSITIGADCFVNDGCRFDTSASIAVGDDVYLGHDVAVITSSHHIGDATRRAYGSVSEAVDIGAGTWVGARAIILPGVTIGRGAVIAAGSVVTRAVDADTLVGGVPARCIRPLDPYESAPRPSG